MSNVSDPCESHVKKCSSSTQGPTSHPPGNSPPPPAVVHISMGPALTPPQTSPHPTRSHSLSVNPARCLAMSPPTLHLFPAQPMPLLHLTPRLVLSRPSSHPFPDFVSCRPCPIPGPVPAQPSPYPLPKAHTSSPEAHTSSPRDPHPIPCPDTLSLTCHDRLRLQKLDRSSIAKSSPPMGALKAAATPAATPAVVKARLK